MEIVLEALLDTIKLVPFLYVVYIIIGYFEVHSDNRLYKKLAHTSLGGPVIGALIGCVPQCGFSVMGANLYSKKMIGMGTLIAIFISTSDEAIPILLAHPEMIGMVGVVLMAKVMIAIVAGLGIEGFSYLAQGKRMMTFANGMTMSTDEMVEGHCGCGCEKNHQKPNLWIVALKHTIRIVIFIFIVNLVLNVVIEGIGEGRLGSILLTGSLFQPLLAALIGLIPNCAASIILTEMFVTGSISLGSLIAGLCTGAGVGLVVLFKANKNIMDNLKILGILYVIGAVCGMLIQFIR
ncbi:MAG: putative manganese transporter [Cellulosilyticum sp.]|nr:arsenic efflux protein [Cellulosilyticum sp.]MEE1073463.1 putative manganese transporter [Cellulosilyticum sp.]